MRKVNGGRSSHLLLVMTFFLSLQLISTTLGISPMDNEVLQSSSSPIRVIGSTPPDGKIIKQGYDVRLSCKTSMKWFFCLWKSPDGDKQCAIQEKQPRNVCSGDERVVLEGGSNHCDVILKNVTSVEDYGKWMCMVNDAESFESTKHYINLEVAQKAVVEFDPPFGSDRVLTITEGETQQITCTAKNAHPTPQISWREPDTADLDITSDPRISRDPLAHTTDVSHTAKYKADLKDNNRMITCIATQLDHDGRSILYEDYASVRLKVEEIVLPIDNALQQKIGIISGVLLAIIFLILLIVFIIFAVCRNRRRRKRSRPSSSQMSIATNDHQPSPQPPPLKPIWTTKSPNTFVVGNVVQKNNEELLRNAENIRKYEIQISPTNSGIVVQSGRVGVGGNGPSDHGNKRPSSAVTMSTGSQGSWEEDRSVGCEILESNLASAPDAIIIDHPSLMSSPPHPLLHPSTAIPSEESPRQDQNQPVISRSQRLPPPEPGIRTMPTSLQETHFDVQDGLNCGDDVGSEYDYHNHPIPPHPTSRITPHEPLRQTHLVNEQRPSSTDQPIYYPSYIPPTNSGSTRPSSAMSYPASVADPTQPIQLMYYNFPGSRRLPTPNGPVTTSGVSVFDCELGCFIIPPDGSNPQTSEDVDLNTLITRNQANINSEEAPRDV